MWKRGFMHTAGSSCRRIICSSKKESFTRMWSLRLAPCCRQNRCWNWISRYTITLFGEIPSARQRTCRRISGICIRHWSSRCGCGAQPLELQKWMKNAALDSYLNMVQTARMYQKKYRPLLKKQFLRGKAATPWNHFRVLVCTCNVRLYCLMNDSYKKLRG